MTSPFRSCSAQLVLDARDKFPLVLTLCLGGCFSMGPPLQWVQSHHAKPNKPGLHQLLSSGIKSHSFLPCMRKLCNMRGALYFRVHEGLWLLGPWVSMENPTIPPTFLHRPISQGQPPLLFSLPPLGLLELSALSITKALTHP